MSMNKSDLYQGQNPGELRKRLGEVPELEASRPHESRPKASSAGRRVETTFGRH